MRSFFIISAFMLMHVCLCAQVKPTKAVLRINTEDFLLNREKTLFELRRSPLDGSNVTADSLFLNAPITEYLIDVKEPFMAEAYLFEDGMKISFTSTFWVTHDTIQIRFGRIPNASFVFGGENEYHQDNQWLYLSLPAVIVNDPAFKLTKLRSAYESGIEPSALSFRYAEYEKKVLKEIAGHSNYFYALFGLYQKRENFTTKMLDTCYHLLADTLKRTYYGKLLYDYIQNAKKLFVDAPVPVFSVEDEAGEKHISTPGWYAQQEYTLIEFWASWCLPCRNGMRIMKKELASLDSTVCKIITVSIDEVKEEWMEALRTEDFPWKHYRDSLGWKGLIAQTFNLIAIPANILVNRKGHIVAKNISTEDMVRIIRRGRY